MVHGSAAWTHSGLPGDRFPTINAWTTEEKQMLLLCAVC